ncbi:MAG: histone deacetylase [Bacillota bacterium]|jgi:acetoin utilization deacetylase AcuC-like enzyme
MTVLVTYHEDFSNQGYPFLKYRLKPSFQALQKLVSEKTLPVKVIEPRVTEDIINLVDRIHNWRHIRDVQDSGYYEVSLLSVASVVQAAELLSIDRTYSSGFAYVGAAGHHASPMGFWGFCFLNDIAAAITRLRDLGKDRFLILDVDPHFGDGTRAFFEKDKNVIHINIYTGNKDEIDLNLNNYDYGLPYNANDDDFEVTLERALSHSFDFDLMFIVFGHDSHISDYGGFAFSDAVYPILANKVKEYAAMRPHLWVLSGGSEIEVASRVIPAIIKVLAKDTKGK